MENKIFRAKNIFCLLVVLIIIISFCSCCKKRTGDSTDMIYYDVHITYNATFPNVCTYYGDGDAILYDYGDHATISGTITVGQATFSAEFEGTLEGDTFTLTTTTFQVQYEFDDQTYTEEITIDFNDFSISGTTVTATGDYTAVTNPGNTTEAGSVTFLATETKNSRTNIIANL